MSTPQVEAIRPYIGSGVYFGAPQPTAYKVPWAVQGEAEFQQVPSRQPFLKLSPAELDAAVEQFLEDAVRSLVKTEDIRPEEELGFRKGNPSKRYETPAELDAAVERFLEDTVKSLVKTEERFKQEEELERLSPKTAAAHSPTLNIRQHIDIKGDDHKPQVQPPQGNTDYQIKIEVALYDHASILDAYALELEVLHVTCPVHATYKAKTGGNIVKCKLSDLFQLELVQNWPGFKGNKGWGSNIYRLHGRKGPVKLGTTVALFSNNSNLQTRSLPNTYRLERDYERNVYRVRLFVQECDSDPTIHPEEVVKPSTPWWDLVNALSAGNTTSQLRPETRTSSRLCDSSQLFKSLRPSVQPAGSLSAAKDNDQGDSREPRSRTRGRGQRHLYSGTTFSTPKRRGPQFEFNTHDLR